MALNAKQRTILAFCEQIGRPVTAKEIVNAKFPGKKQPHINSDINNLVSQGSLIRNDNAFPYTVRLREENEAMPPQKDYSRGSNKSSNSISAVRHITAEQSFGERLSTAPLIEQENSINGLLFSFFHSLNNSGIEIYNEFSFQHELGIYLREKMPNHKVQFERNVSFFSNSNALPNTIKREIDISVFSESLAEKYAIELKYPHSGRYPETMYDFVKDIRFMEQLKIMGFTQTYSIALVSDKLFYQGPETSGIYRYFRKDYFVSGKVYKPTGGNKNIEFISLDGTHNIKWYTLDEIRKFYIVET